eukprot:CAMPEP_0169480930 /NCGR_PEP_ID=MMETSP1042-20121227/29835_1 /TAXON_ID=464988 /ORGANISM="Hemiselmis andersenii, Strain CCMP1180" /LENGTH=48 /DNA_ID= /DNA_START= /DNA_END= /DNA_ORIENTATION=
MSSSPGAVSGSPRLDSTLVTCTNALSSTTSDASPGHASHVEMSHTPAP